jgi:N-acetylglucosamine-6-phosphate deacetylase
MLERRYLPIWDDRLTATAIFDGHHLDEAFMQVLWKVKGPDRLILVSDAAALARCEPGIYEAAIGGKVELSPAGRLSLAGTPYLAGAALGLPEAIQNAVRLAHMKLEDAIRCITTNVWSYLGESAPTDDAVWFEWDDLSNEIHIMATQVNGQILHGTKPAEAMRIG